MKILYYDCFAGISGDMNLGALVDLGVPGEYLRSELSRLSLDNEFSLRFEKQQKMGITGTRALVELHPAEEDERVGHHNHGNGHGHTHADAHAHHHVHRNFTDIRALIEASALPARVRETAIAIFEQLALAEAKIHGVEIDGVHFHEVGAVDAIVDIVGAAICLDSLQVDRIISSPVELGGGLVDCAHGRLPVPAPATAEILKGVPTTRGRVQAEAATPTGAAILKTIVDEFLPAPALRVRKIGYGLGNYDFPIPNVLRVMLADTVEDAAEPLLRGYRIEENLLVQTNVDDMAAEEFEPLMDALFGAGALDVFFSPIVMKKSRPATMVSVLLEPERLEAVADVLFFNSSTFGMRVLQTSKIMLHREIQEVSTAYGPVRIKIGRRKTGATGQPLPEMVRWKIEYEDLKRLSARNDLSVKRLREILASEIGAKIKSGL